MRTRLYVIITTVLFGLIAIGQAVRLLNGWPVQVGTWTVPLWPSAIACPLALGLCIWGLFLFVRTTP